MNPSVFISHMAGYLPLGLWLRHNATSASGINTVHVSTEVVKNFDMHEVDCLTTLHHHFHPLHEQMIVPISVMCFFVLQDNLAIEELMGHVFSPFHIQHITRYSCIHASISWKRASHSVCTWLGIY